MVQDFHKGPRRSKRNQNRLADKPFVAAINYGQSGFAETCNLPHLFGFLGTLGYASIFSMSSSFDHPLHPSDPGISRILIATTWPFTCLSIIFVLARVYVRKVHPGRLSSDDWVMVFAVVLQIIYQALLTLACEWGFGMATSNMTLEQYKKSHMYSFATQTPGTLISLVARVSIVILLIRIFGKTRPWFKWFLIGFTLLQAVAVFLNLAFEWAWMSPISVHWDPTVKATRFMDSGYEVYSAVAWLGELLS